GHGGRAPLGVRRRGRGRGGCRTPASCARWRPGAWSGRPPPRPSEPRRRTGKKPRRALLPMDGDDAKGDAMTGTAPGEPQEAEAVVVGAGQAGLSAAWHLRRLGLVPGTDAVVLDRGPAPGGAWQFR